MLANLECVGIDSDNLNGYRLGFQEAHQTFYMVLVGMRNQYDTNFLDPLFLQNPAGSFPDPRR